MIYCLCPSVRVPRAVSPLGKNVAQIHKRASLRAATQGRGGRHVVALFRDGELRVATARRHDDCRRRGRRVREQVRRQRRRRDVEDARRAVAADALDLGPFNHISYMLSREPRDTVLASYLGTGPVRDLARRAVGKEHDLAAPRLRLK